MNTYLVHISKGDFLELQEYRMVEIEAENNDHANRLVEAKLLPYEWIEELETVKIS